MADLGTPTDLKDAITRGLNEILGESIVRRDSPEVRRLHDIIQDRLAQTFQAAVCERDHADAIMRVWHAIFPKRRRHS